MNILPRALDALIEELGRLPGVGPRTAERYAVFILKAPVSGAQSLALALQNLHASVGVCPITFMLTDSNDTVSPLYSDASRNKQVVAIVEDPFDVVALEKTGRFNGTYHVLGGVISPIDGRGPEVLRIDELLGRITTDTVTEVILATNASVEGESTALYVQQQIAETHPSVHITRLARGLPAGVDLEYADQITLARALDERKAL